MKRSPDFKVETNRVLEFCRCHCCNTGCSKHISKGMKHTGTCEFFIMKNTAMCEGYISNWQQMKNKLKEANIK